MMDHMYGWYHLFENTGQGSSCTMHGLGTIDNRLWLEVFAQIRLELRCVCRVRK